MNPLAMNPPAKHTAIAVKLNINGSVSFHRHIATMAASVPATMRIVNAVTRASGHSRTIPRPAIEPLNRGRGSLK